MQAEVSAPWGPCSTLALPPGILPFPPFLTPHPSPLQGVLRMQQEVEVRPGIITKDAEGRVKCIPIYSRIVSLFTEHNELQYAVPGGLIGVGLTVREAEGGEGGVIGGRGGRGSDRRARKHQSDGENPEPPPLSPFLPPPPQVDPTLTRADRLVGQVLGQVGELPDVYSELEINFFLLRRLLGVRSKEGEKQGKVGGRGVGGAGSKEGEKLGKVGLGKGGGQQ